MAGWKTIEVDILETDDQLEYEETLIIENFARAELTTLERGEQALRLDEIYEARGIRAKASPGTNQYTKEVSVKLAGTKTTKQIAKELSMSARALQRSKQIAKNLSPAIKAIAVDISMSENQMLSLSKLPYDEQQARAYQYNKNKQDREALRTPSVTEAIDYNADDDLTIYNKYLRNNENEAIVLRGVNAIAIRRLAWKAKKKPNMFLMETVQNYLGIET